MIETQIERCFSVLALVTAVNYLLSTSHDVLATAIYTSISVSVKMINHVKKIN